MSSREQHEEQIAIRKRTFTSSMRKINSDYNMELDIYLNDLSKRVDNNYKFDGEENPFEKKLQDGLKDSNDNFEF